MNADDKLDRILRADARQASFERQLEPGWKHRRLSHVMSVLRRRRLGNFGATLSAMKRALVGLAVAAAVAVVTACVKPGPPSADPTRNTHAASTVGFSDTAETVMGTLVAPPSRRFLGRIRNGKMGGVVLLRNGWLTRSTAALR